VFWSQHAILNILPKIAPGTKHNVILEVPSIVLVAPKIERSVLVPLNVIDGPPLKSTLGDTIEISASGAKVAELGTKMFGQAVARPYFPAPNNKRVVATKLNAQRPQEIL
jgi:hypothetical protein